MTNIRTMIEYEKDGTIRGYVEPLGMWMEFESEDQYYEYVESFENRED